MSANYDASVVGVPYVRGTQVVINWPDATGGLPVATVSQSTAVKLADGTVRNLDVLSPIVYELDFVNHGNDPIPLVNPTDGSSLGANTTLNNTMLQILAVIRYAQNASGQ